MMRIGIDVRAACAEHRTGKGQWTFGFVHELLHREVPVTLYTDRRLPEAWHPLVEASDGRIRVECHAPGLWWHVVVARSIKRDPGIEAYVSTVSYIVPFLVGRTKKVIPVVHDLIAFRREAHDRKASLIERVTLGRCVRNAHFVCTVSDATKRDVLGRYPSLRDAHVVVLSAAPSSSTARPWKPDGRTILMIGTLSPRKNQLRLIEAFARLPDPVRDAHTLVLVGGRGWMDAAIVQRASMEKNVTWAGYQPDDACDRLFETATVFAFPSLYEGFGLPVLDALQTGIPVLTSNRGSLGEVAGDAALFVDPESVASIRDGLLKILTDGDLRRELSEAGKRRARQFSWQRSVDLFLYALDAAEGVQ